jgi:starch-binding outer membrane protein, SusD/RagB family
MKKIFLPILVLLATACGQELDVDPTTSVDSNTAKKSIDLMVTGAYALIGSGAPAGLEGGLYSTDLLLNGDLLASEDYMTWRGTFNQYNEIASKAMSTTNSSVTRMWRKGYLAINLANIILKELETSENASKDYYRAQALLIRGIVHFELVRFFGEPSTGRGIPLMTAPTENFDDITYPTRASIDEVYTQVLADLNEAKTILTTNTGEFSNLEVVTAFLARIYLQKGDFANALTNANEVIESGVYELPASVEEGFNGTSSETIFEIEQTTINNAGTANDGLTTFYSCDPNTPGSAGRGDVQIDDAFIDQYESFDKRRSLLIYTGTCNKASVTSAKWKDPYANIPIIRLSEMYLIRAEANVRLGSNVGDTPTNDINAIRDKAGASVYDSNVTLANVLLERELELAFEGHRIHDFRRTSKVVGSAVYVDDMFVLPIPQTERNTNPNLEQNTFYTVN